MIRFCLILQINCFIFILKQCVRVNKIVKETKFEGVWDDLESKNGLWRQSVAK